MGSSVAEALVALLLGLFLVHLGLTTAQQLRMQQHQAARRVDALTAARLTRTVLRGELDRGRSEDWVVHADSFRLRAFRGTGVVCRAEPSASESRVAYRGDRAPEPTKDSVELISSDGTVVHRALESAVSDGGSCPGAEVGESTMSWTLSGVVPEDVVLARVYESGSYHLTGEALRYRRGAGGRQPLTPPVWRDSGTGFQLIDSVTSMTLESTVPQGPAGSEFLSWMRR